MKSLQYSYTPLLQPTNAACTQTATAMLVSHLSSQYKLETILREAPVYTDPNGTELGSSLPELAAWCLGAGFTVTLYTFDSMLIDLSWQDLRSSTLLERLEVVRATRSVRSLGKALSTQYVDDYIQFLQQGGKLVIQSYPSSDLLEQLIRQGPFCVGVNQPTLRGTGHGRSTGLRQSQPDDTHNGIATHAVMIYGRNIAGEFLVADPWGNPSTYTIGQDQLIAAIMATQWFCDNVIFQITT